jgi:hypothetical protein
MFHKIDPGLDIDQAVLKLAKEKHSSLFGWSAEWNTREKSFSNIATW